MSMFASTVANVSKSWCVALLAHRRFSVQAVQVRLCSVSFRHLPQMVVTVTVATRRLPVGQLAEVYQVVAVCLTKKV